MRGICSWEHWGGEVLVNAWSAFKKKKLCRGYTDFPNQRVPTFLWYSWGGIQISPTTIWKVYPLVMYSKWSLGRAGRSGVWENWFLLDPEDVCEGGILNFNSWLTGKQMLYKGSFHENQFNLGIKYELKRRAEIFYTFERGVNLFTHANGGGEL